MVTWSSPVRYGEVDQQGVVFNAHYLLYCDEAMNAFCRQRSLPALADQVQLVRSVLNWHASARWGEVVSVQATCTRLGTSSFDLDFDIRTDRAACCTVQTIYVLVGADGRPTPLPQDVRDALQDP